MFRRFKIDKATGLPETPNGETWEVTVHAFEYCHLTLWTSDGLRAHTERLTSLVGSYLTPNDLTSRRIRRTARKMLADRYPSTLTDWVERKRKERRERYSKKRAASIEKYVGTYPPNKL